MNFLCRRIAFLFIAMALAGALSHAVGQAIPNSAAHFPPLEQWKAAIITGNATALRALYSSDPPARVMTATGDSSTDTEIAFWTGLKPRRMKLDVIQSESPQAGAQKVVFQVELQSASAPGEHVLYVTEGQLWQQTIGGWKLVASKRSEATKLQQPTSTSKAIYAPGLDAHAEIQQALVLASKQHKNVIIVFGANWCYDCHVLDLAFHRPDLAGVLQRNYEVVHVDVGEGDKNQDIMQQYHVPMKKGIPALAVLNGYGKLLYSQQGGEFEKARSLAPEDLLAFLNKWKPEK
ncbi:MAG: thioredoxin family protein [Candidatus Korobacteraceae bacterium]|jgi:thioredoxin family protein